MPLYPPTRRSFLKIKYPRDFGGPEYLETPEFMYRIIPTEAGRQAGTSFGQAPGALAWLRKALGVDAVSSHDLAGCW